MMYYIFFKDFEFDFISKILKSHSFYFLLSIVFLFLFSTNLYDIITLCIILSNVILSNMSHLVYTTLSDEADGVTLSRLKCTEYIFGAYI